MHDCSTIYRLCEENAKDYEEALNVIYWDMRTGAPKKGLAQRSEVIGTLSASLFDMQTSEELGELLAALEAQKLILTM